MHTHDFPKPVRPLIRNAVRAGWTVNHSRKGQHIHFRTPTGRLVVGAWSPSCSRALMNLKRDLKHAGLDVEDGK